MNELMRPSQNANAMTTEQSRQIWKLIEEYNNTHIEA